jgi:hypothetical protein
MRRAAVRLMALEDIGRAAREQLTDRQEIEFREQYEAAQAGLPSAVWGAYLTTVAPSHEGLWEGREFGIRPYGSSDSLSRRVWERLRDEGRLLERFDPDFLLARSDERFKVLWPEGQAQVNVAKLWDYFARYGYLPILAGREVLQETIAWGVQRGLFAYCLGEPPDAYDTIHVDDPDLRAARCVISENAWLVDVDRARALVAPPEPEETAAPPVDAPAPPVTEPGPKLPTPAPAPSRRYAGLRIEAGLDPLKWRQFFNSVLQPLIDTGATLEITVTLAARHDEGLDPDLIDLRVRESATQLGRDVRVEIDE